MKGTKFLAAFVWALLLAAPAFAQQDIQVIGGTNPYVIIGRNINWAGSGPGNLNNNFIFSPIDPNEGFCLFLANKNTTSAHSVSVSVTQTGDPSLKTFIGQSGRWFNVPTTTTFPTSVPSSTTVGINYKTTASANVTVSFSGATAQAGSPDTLDIFAVQTNQSSCGSLSTNVVQGPYQNGTTATNAQQFPVLVGGSLDPGTTGPVAMSHIGSFGQGWLLDGGVCCQAWASGFVTAANMSSSTFTNLKSANGNSTEGETIVDVFPMGSLGPKGFGAGYVRTNFLEEATDQNFLTQSNQAAWVVLGKLTNPASGAMILSQFSTIANPTNPAFKDLILSCSAACELTVGRITARGTTCTTLTPQSLQTGNGGTVLNPNAADITENGCTGAATAATLMYDLNLAAGIPARIDLSGFVNFHNAGQGSGIQVLVVTGITGVTTASLTWMEQ